MSYDWSLCQEKFDSAEKIPRYVIIYQQIKADKK